MKSACLMLFVCLFSIVLIGCDNSVAPNEPNDPDRTVLWSKDSLCATTISYSFFANSKYEVKSTWKRRIVTIKYVTWTDERWYDKFDMEFPATENLIYNYKVSGFFVLSPAGPFWTNEIHYSTFTIPYESIKKSIETYACTKVRIIITASDGIQQITEDYEFSLY